MVNNTDFPSNGPNDTRKSRYVRALDKFFPKVETFIGLTNTQQGVIILACSFMVSSVSSLLTNITLYSPEMTFVNLMIYLFNMCVLTTWTFALAGSIRRKYFVYLKRALILWTIFIIMWITAVIFSFFDFGIILVCLESRCPESFWTFNNTWHNISSPVPEFRPHTPEDDVWTLLVDKIHVDSLQSHQFDREPPPPLLNTFLRLSENYVTEPDKNHGKEKKKKQNDLIVNDQNDEEYKQKYIRALHFAAKIAMSVINAIILLYSWLILFSLYSEFLKICAETQMQRRTNNDSST